MDERLNDLTTEQLIDAIANYKKYNYSEATRDDAFQVLKARKVPRAKMDWLAEKFASQKRETEHNKRKPIAISKRYKLFAAIAMTGYFPGIVFFPIILVLYSLISGETVDIFLEIFGPLCLITAFVFHALTMNQLLIFRALVGGENDISLIRYILFYGILFLISPAIIIYNFFYMRRSIRSYDA